MSLVNVHNEWDPLEEVIVGRAVNARIARPDKGLFAVEYRDYGRIENIPSGQYPQCVIEETEEDLEALIQAFQKLGVTVNWLQVSSFTKLSEIDQLFRCNFATHARWAEVFIA